jgi:ribosomal protein L11 methyltransferase
VTREPVTEDYIEISLDVAVPDAERVADVVRIETGRTAWIELPFVQPDLESHATITTGARATVRAYITAREDDSAITERLRQALLSVGIAAHLGSASVAEEDWAEGWKAYFDVERYGERLVVVPSWRQFQASPKDLVIDLDPGMAFGTGQHETTRMCLEALEQRVKPGDVVLDLGSGSGILSIAAAKLGAREVYALDVDVDCARITADNARRNHVERSVHARAGSLGDAWPFDEAPVNMFDLIVANIVAAPIIDLSRDIADALRPGGRLVTSGIIAERERDVTAALESTGLRVEAVRTDGEWRCLEGLRP